MNNEAVAHKAMKSKNFTTTRNACKVCSPLGASIAFKGLKGCVPLIHGSQGCATYIRRYLISHYKEPVDIASSNFNEDSTIFGGQKNFNTGIDNIINQYNPQVIAIASTCLSETIGEDVQAFIRSYKKMNAEKKLPYFVYASTPSYQGTHMDGFHEAVAAVVKQFAEKKNKGTHVNLFPGFVSTEDIRHLQEIMNDFETETIICSDYSQTLDNTNWKEYQRIPPGGVTVQRIKQMGDAVASIEFGHILNLGSVIGRAKQSSLNPTGAKYLKDTFDIEHFRLTMPIGVKSTDEFFEVLEKISNKKIPEKYEMERGRLLDAYIDGHKYVFGKKAILYGEEDFVAAMIRFLDEIGVDTVLCATGGESGKIEKLIKEQINKENLLIKQGLDFEEIAELSRDLSPDLFIGSSRGYYIARELDLPIVRVGFPIHDRMGGQRIQHLGYKGTQQLFDKIVNALIEYKQEKSPVGYKYI